ncbi:MAG: response regulator [Firmicutes bacterium]|nr:response regulator [Bacillota bacterium]
MAQMYKVLIIDDEPWSREVVKALGAWESLQLAVIGEAEDGTEGLKLIRELEPDIVITDMRMPDLGGVEFLKAMNERFPSLKIIVISGYDDFVYLKQAIRSRAVEYLLKPIDPEELNASLAQCARELEQAHANVNMSWRTPLVFADNAVLDRYLAYRQRVYGYLLELNKPAVLHTLENLGEFLERSLPEAPDGNMLTKIGHDFILILEEFTSENEIGFDSIWSDGNRKETFMVGWNSISEAIKDIGLLYGETIDAIEAFRRNKNRLDIRGVQTHIDRHFQDPISLETIAQHFFISKEHLSRAFKTFTGENISDYIIRRRMEKAKELILEQRLAIKHVAEMTGYTDLAYFYRVFKKYYGLTPGELRKED